MIRRMLVELSLRSEEDVFLARQLGRECALGLGLERLDALRAATAISELGREVVGVAGDEAGRLRLTAEDTTLEIELRTASRSQQWTDAIGAVARLVDSHDVSQDENGAVVRLRKGIPGPTPEVDALTDLHEQLLAQAPTSAAEELREQNRDLLNALEEVRARRAELEVVNRELEETNHGVMALYSELSAELDRTNQGVVALYAEIDDKNVQLRQASEAKSRFLRSISHELRTPVNSILGLTGLLLDPHQIDRLTSEHTEQVQYIRASAGDLQRLVDELLDLAKAEAGRLEPKPTEVTLEDLFADLTGIIEPILREGVTLHVEREGADVIVTDAGLLRHVLRNLLSNAAKFTTAGSVTLSATGADGMVTFAIRDTGVGIAPEDLDRIFEEFYQATSALHATTKGTGLGLPFAQVVATALGGRIEVESAPNEGSCFTMRLPVHGTDRGAAAASGHGDD